MVDEYEFHSSRQPPYMSDHAATPFFQELKDMIIAPFCLNPELGLLEEFSWHGGDDLSYRSGISELKPLNQPQDDVSTAVPRLIQLSDEDTDDFDDVSEIYHPNRFFQYAAKDGQTDLTTCSNQAYREPSHTIVRRMKKDLMQNGLPFFGNEPMWIPSEITLSPSKSSEQRQDRTNRTRASRQTGEARDDNQVILKYTPDTGSIISSTCSSSCPSGSSLTSDTIEATDIDGILDDLAMEELRAEMADYDEFETKRPRGMLRAVADPSCMFKTLSAPVKWCKKAIAKRRSKRPRWRTQKSSSSRKGTYGVAA